LKQLLKLEYITLKLESQPLTISIVLLCKNYGRKVIKALCVGYMHPLFIKQ